MIEGISPIDEVSTPEPDASSGALGRDDFLRMLVAQLENQDPLNPQDATEFTAQLAQFSSLEQLLAISTGLEDLAAAQRLFTESFQGLSSTGLIGREVLAAGSRVQVGPGSTSRPAFELEDPASEVTLVLTDERGGRVGKVDLGSLGSGLHEVSAATSASASSAAGVYGFSVEAETDAGDAVPALTRVLGTVTGIVPSGASAGLELGSVSVPFGEIVRVRAAEALP